MISLEPVRRQALQAIRRELAAAGLDAILVTGWANIRYLSGFTGTAGALLISNEQACLLSDSRYLLQAQQEAPEFSFLRMERSVPEGAISHLQPYRRIAFEPAHLSYQQHCQLSQGLPGSELVPLDGAIEKLRIKKLPAELELIQRAAQLTDRTLEFALSRLAPGRSEREIALEAEHHALVIGADRVAFDFIFAAGPRSALPHAKPTDRRLAPGDLVVMDLGTSFGGYASDLTRTVCLAPAPDWAREIYQVCRRAQRAGLEAIRPAVVCSEADAAARQVIEQAGYGECFGHGLGHGVGLEIHEQPRLSRLETAALEAGMVVTCEPGIYLPERGGVRIEDLVVVTDQGCRVLSRAPKPEELPVVGKG